VLTQTGPPILLRGKAVQSDGTAPDRYLLIRDGRIVSVSRQRPPRSDHTADYGGRVQDWRRKRRVAR